MRQLQHSRRIDQDHGIQIPTVCASAAQLPFRDESFDIVFSAFGALRSLPTPRAFAMRSLECFLRADA
ncbi:MAG: class I SAM-dependent methyltransferase [Marmoricola sp.]